MFKRILIITLLFALPAAAKAAVPALNPQVIASLGQAIDDGKVRAVSIGLYDSGAVQVSGFGQVSRTDNAKPQSDTLFEIGSITKVFTSLLAQTQVDANRLGWDDTIAKRFPDVEFVNDGVASITLRELSSHTSGLPRLPDNTDSPDPMDPYKGYERAHMLHFLTAYDPDELVKEYAYSNLGAGLLGMIAADSAGLTYSQALTRDVLQPLGMVDTGSRIRDEQSVRLAKGFSVGADMPNWSGFDALSGAGALLSTSDDLLTFIGQNLDPKTLRQSLVAIRERQADGETALGWHVSEFGTDGPVYWHNGGTGGYASFLGFRPATATGVVILSTSTEYDLITQLGFAQMSGEFTTQQENVRLDAYPGVYQIAEGFVLTVSIDGGGLIAQATEQGAFPLTASTENEFVFPAADIRIVFGIDTSGVADNLTLYQGGQVMSAPRIGDAEIKPVPQALEEIEVSESTLAEYVGRYQLAPKAIVSVLVRDGQLFAQLTGQMAYPVFAYAPDKFFFKVVDAQLFFQRDEDGVNSVVLQQNGEQRAPRIE